MCTWFSTKAKEAVQREEEDNAEQHDDRSADSDDGFKCIQQKKARKGKGRGRGKGDR